ncbi:MAG TPA: ATP-binding protein [Verrucomicrobiae bacterium]|jgi:signal transduction histidine kinase|nr:ATP-binding protein [Verrucomicrobiae bacterium]
METLIRALLVESDSKFARLLRESLSGLTGSRIDLSTSETLADAIERLQQGRFDAILLNFSLPDSDGLPTFTRMHAEAPSLPIVILTCHENEALALQAVRHGAQDYLVKSKVDGKILSRVIRYAIERKRSELKLISTNSELLKTNYDLARSEEALRRALEELRASHQRLKAAQLQLIQAAKMECVGTLAAGVAHEVKNPLQTILMGLSYLSKNMPSADQTVFIALSDMRDAVKRADAIVRDLLYLSAARQLEIQPEDINTVLEHSLSYVNYDLIRSRVEVERDLAKDLPLVPLDKPKMEQVFINLFVNAIHAMPNGGGLHLRTRRAQNPDQEETLEKFQPGEPLVLIEIEDTGSGIPSEKLPRIFEPFFTTKPNGVGTGLGLPVSKQIVELHGGAITLGAGAQGGARASLLLKVEQENHEKETNFAN